MASPILTYYVYYKVPVESEPQARALSERLQSELEAATGVSGVLLRRRDKPTTWMEVYERGPDPEAFEAALGAIVTRLGATQFLEPGTGRHTEVFKPF